MKSNAMLQITAAVVAAVCGLAGDSQAQTVIDTIDDGSHDGFYYSFWKDSGDAAITLHPGGRYTARFDASTNNWIGGLGWNPGGPKQVVYSGSYTPDANANSYLTLYGWMNGDPVIEYYILESWGTWSPASAGVYYGSYQSDGARYDLYYHRRIPKGIDPLDIVNYYAIRRDKLPHGPVSGTINTRNHFQAWQRMGVVLPSHEFMIMATESYQGGGSSDLTVSEADLSCGTHQTLPVCCSIDADANDDGWGEQDGAACVVTETTAGYHPANSNHVVAAINVGGIFASVAVDDIWFEPHRYVTGAVSRATQITLTDEAYNPILQSAGFGDLRIAIPIDEPQTVQVALGFAETVYDAPGERVFSVVVEGETVHQDVDLVAVAGRFVPWQPQATAVQVSDGELNIELSASAGESSLSYVLVTRAESPTGASSSASTSSSSSSSSASASSGMSSSSSNSSSSSGGEGTAAGCADALWLLKLWPTLWLLRRRRMRR